MTTHPLDPLLALSSELPELPEPEYMTWDYSLREYRETSGYTADQMRAYATEAVHRAANARGEWLPIESAPEGEFLALVQGRVFSAFRFGGVIKAEYCSAPFMTPPTHWLPYPAPPAPGSEAKS